MKKFLPLVAAVAFLTSHAQENLPVDKKATEKTVKLYQNLKQLLHKGIMFGHQDDLAYGYGWKFQAGRSDVKEVTGDYPAVYGWELGHLEIDKPVNLDGVPFDKMKEYIRQGYERGGVITISWHMNNPLTGKLAWDASAGAVTAILPNGEKHNLYKSWLDKLAVFMLDLKGRKGELIPVVFRPYHELNGNWFWWGKDHCTPDQFKQLWRFTVSYLRDEKHLHHLLYAFSTHQFNSREEYLERYPGDEWVDVTGVDIYQRGNNNEAFIKDTGNMLTMLENIASEKKKIPALTEFGYGTLPDSHWWTQTFGKALANHKISWALAWRNAGKRANGSEEFYVPYKGQGSADDFRKFSEWERILFQTDVAKEGLYQ